MAPSKFQIYVDQSMRQSTVAPGEPPNQQQPQPTNQHFSEPQSKITVKTAERQAGDQAAQANVLMAYNCHATNPGPGIEFSFEELRYLEWKEHQEIMLRRELELKRQMELAEQARQYQEHPQLNSPHSAPNRLSIVPQSLQPTSHGDNDDASCYGNLNEAPSVVLDCWKHTLQVPGITDKFTVPIDQSQYIREHCPTSTPNNKDDKAKRSRRMSRPSVGGSPTMKLSPINETSRDCNSKSSSSSSAISTTPATVKKPLVLRPIEFEPDRPLDPNDPTTFRKLLRALAEPLDRRSGFMGVDESMPEISTYTRIEFGEDCYLVGKQLQTNPTMFIAHLLVEDSDESGGDVPDKDICFRVDRPHNDWLFYICHELHRRLVRQKTKPDIELSVMNADPAIMYPDGSILVDEYFRFVTLEHYLMACTQANKPVPRSMATYISLELIQLLRGLHSCDIVHMNINSSNIVIMGVPFREDIENIEERTSVIKLIGFDRAMDTRLLPTDFKFNNKVNYMTSSEVLEGRPWCHEIDWLGALACIHRMFFLEEMIPIRDQDGKWKVHRNFDSCPTNVWASLFDVLLNSQDAQTALELVDHAVGELSTWIKANSNLVLKEALAIELLLDDFWKSVPKSN